MPADVYLDAASAAPLRPEAHAAVVAALDLFGDPLMFHSRGRASREALDDARVIVAQAIGAQPDEVVFTSGGTESVSLAIWGAVRAQRELGTRIVTGSIEHPAVGGVCNVLESDGFEVVPIPTEPDGRADLDRFAAEVRRPGTLLASLQHANHEIGTMQQIGEAARLCRAAGVLFHTDACQTVGRLPVEVVSLGVDLLSMSSHKFGGPPGVGALYVRRGVGISAYPCGDDRERKRRSGMENIPGIVGMAAALEVSVAGMADEAARLWGLTAELRERLAAIDGVAVLGHATHRTPHLVCFAVDGLDAATLAMSLDDRGFQLGAGSPCSGRPGDPSPVLEQIGLAGAAAFRVSLGPTSSTSDVETFLRDAAPILGDLRRIEQTSSEAMTRFRRPPGP